MLMLRVKKKYSTFCVIIILILIVIILVISSFQLRSTSEEKFRPWFMKGGFINRLGAHPKLWPHEDKGDRIVEQLMYIPIDYALLKNHSNVSLKNIYILRQLTDLNNIITGQEEFLNSKCPVDTCSITYNFSEMKSADMIIFTDTIPQQLKYMRKVVPQSQVWMYFQMEAPEYTRSISFLEDSNGLFNWTATYRHDSDIVVPYEKFVLYTDVQPLLNQNYAANKTKQVAWLVSNCRPWNERLLYANELAKYIGVDTFGMCGSKKCEGTFCFQMLKQDYKFYLAFENSNCRDYITEKFFINGLGNEVIPIVMGARSQDYQRSAPPNSYIDVEDFKNPKALAYYLHELDKNDALYNKYFEWKTTGEFINTYFWCRVCAMLHAPPVPKVYADIQTWWSGKGTCTKDKWKRWSYLKFNII